MTSPHVITKKTPSHEKKPHIAVNVHEGFCKMIKEHDDIEGVRGESHRDLKVGCAKG